MARSANADAAAGAAARSADVELPSDEVVCEAVRSDDLGWSLHVVTRAYAERTRQAVAGLPNGLRGYLLLTRLAHQRAASQLSLALQLGLDRTVMTYLLDDLQSAGLVERRPDPDDRRARQVLLTAAGHTALHRAQDGLRDAERETLAGLTEAERDVLRTLVGRVAGALSSDGGSCASDAADGACG